jgi:hypothetical protein
VSEENKRAHNAGHGDRKRLLTLVCSLFMYCMLYLAPDLVECIFFSASLLDKEKYSLFFSVVECVQIILHVGDILNRFRMDGKSKQEKKKRGGRVSNACIPWWEEETTIVGLTSFMRLSYLICSK